MSLAPSIETQLRDGLLPSLKADQLGKALKVLVYGLNYAPELTGIGKYTGEMVAWLAARGHQVRVVTAPPYYPAWRVQPPYRGFAYQVERPATANRPKVYRTPLWVP